MVSGGTIGRHEGRRFVHKHEQTSEVLQGPDESPSQFYEHLCETFHLYTAFDLEDTENQQMIILLLLARLKGTQGDTR
jgi:hypothetical protein